MYPPKPFETSVAAFVGDVGKYRLSTTPISEKCAFSREFSLPAMPCSRGFRPLFTRSIKAQTGYNLSSRNLIWDVRRIGLVVSHDSVNDGDHLPAGVAHGRHVGLPFISLFLKIKLQRRIVKHRR